MKTLLKVCAFLVSAAVLALLVTIETTVPMWIGVALLALVAGAWHWYRVEMKEIHEVTPPPPVPVNRMVLTFHFELDREVPTELAVAYSREMQQLMMSGLYAKMATGGIELDDPRVTGENAPQLVGHVHTTTHLK